MTEQLALKRQDDSTVAVHAADNMLGMIERVMMDPNLPMDRITSLMDIRERQMNKEAEQAFNVAFANAMAEMPDVPKSGLNKHTGNKYPTLDDLIRTTRPVLSKHGLSLNWQTWVKDDRIFARAIVRHSLGHSISTELDDKRDIGKQMNNLQAGGSTQTYLKRYTGFAILGLSAGDEVDDDGQGAVDKTAISEGQFHELKNLIGRAGLDEDIVLTAEKIGALHFLPASRFESVQKRLLKTIENKAA